MVFRMQSGWDSVSVGTANGGDDIRFATTSWNDFIDGNLHSLVINFDGTTASLTFDGLLEAQGNPTNPSGMHSAFVRMFRNRADNSTLSGQLAEFIFTEDDVTDTEAELITDYLNCRHGI